jgi:hypothetical protein
MMKRALRFGAIVLALVIARPASAVFAQVQQNVGTGNFTSATPVITMAGTGVSNVVVVGCRITDQVATLDSVTDDAANDYAVIGPLDYSTFRMYVVYGVQAISAVNVAMTFSQSTTGRCNADEYSGGAPSNSAIFDTSTTGTGTGTSLAASTLTAVTHGELILALGGRQTGAATFTAGSGFSSGWTMTGQLVMEYKLAGPTSETGPMTISTSQVWGEILVAFRPLSMDVFFGLMK